MKQSILLLLISFAASAQNSEKQIRENRQASNAAIAAHDTASIAKHFTEEVSVLTSRNVLNLGRRKNADAFHNEFLSKTDVIYVRTPRQIEVYDRADMAAESGTWVGSWRTGSEAIKVTGNYYAKWIRRENRWLILAEIFTPLSCEGDSYCKMFVRPNAR